MITEWLPILCPLQSTRVDRGRGVNNNSILDNGRWTALHHLVQLFFEQANRKRHARGTILWHRHRPSRGTLYVTKHCKMNMKVHIIGLSWGGGGHRIIKCITRDPGTFWWSGGVSGTSLVRTLMPEKTRLKNIYSSWRTIDYKMFQIWIL